MRRVRESVLSQRFYVNEAVNHLSPSAVEGQSPKKGGKFKLSKGIQMNKLLAALIASLFAVGAYAADAAKPAASAAKPAASAAEKKAEKKAEKAEAKAEKKADAASAAKK